MILRSGFQTFEFQEGRELRFGSTREAANWLRHLGFPDPDLVIKLRELVTQYSEDTADSRLTDDQVLERLAILLYSRRIVVIGREQRANSGTPAAAAAGPAPAFPLSERAPRTAPPPAPPPASDPPTFGPNASATAQASALVAAAAAGTPFCQECSKS